MLPNSQEYKNALARCERIRGICKEENKYERQRIRDAFDSCALEDLDSALRTIAALQKRVEEAEKGEEEKEAECERFSDALAKAHQELGGDGEWVARIPSQPAPHSGDLCLDVPELARELKKRVEGLERAGRLAYAAMNHMGDVLNAMDACSPEDEAMTTPAFEAIREALKIDDFEEGSIP